MKPRITVAQAPSCNQQTLSLIEHDSRYFLECEGRQLDASHLGHPAQVLIEMMSGPFRPARQPRILFLGLGFGHAILEATKTLPQEKASFIAFSESSQLPGWLEKHLDFDNIRDERIQLGKTSPFDFISSDYAGSQGIFADLDHLEALAPKRWSPASPRVLGNLSDTLKVGGLLGLISTRPIPELEKALRKSGFQVATEFVPVSEKSKKNRTLYIAKKGHYRRSH